MEEGVEVNEKVETPLPGSGRETHKTKEVNGNFLTKLRKGRDR